MNTTIINHNNGSKRIINLIIVDESGSMTSIYRQALDGMNETIKSIREKAAEKDAVPQFINLFTFDSRGLRQHLRHCPANEARLLTSKDYQPCGSTPLYDAIGTTVTALERHITKNDAVLVTIITDGYENSSREYTGNDIKQLIQRLSAKGWLFTYIGANQDVMFEAEKMGINHAMAFSADIDGTNAMWAKERAARAKFASRVSACSPSMSMCDFMKRENDDDVNFFDK